MKSPTTLIAAGAIVLACLFAGPVSVMAQEAAAEEAKPRKSTGRFPSDIPGLEAMQQAAVEEENWLRLLQTTILLRKQQPYEPRHYVSMVQASAEMGRPTTAFHYMLQMQQQGLSYDFDQLPATENLRGTEVYIYLNDLLKRAGDPAGEAERVFDVDSKYANPTAMAWDPTREQFLISTAREGELLAMNDKGKAKVLLSAEDIDGMWAIMDVVVDAESNRLWLTSASIPVYEGFSEAEAGRSALFAFELDSLKLIGRYLPDDSAGPFEFGSLVVDGDGTVYVADRSQPLLLRKKADSHIIAPFVKDDVLYGFRDIAISSDGARLYLVDKWKGILVIDPVNETSAMLEGPEDPPLNFGGIESVMQVGAELIVIQGGISPQRVMGMLLDPSGGAVKEFRPMAIELEDFDRPSGGIIHDEAVYYFANAPSLDSGAQGGDVTVLRTGLDAGQDIMAPDMKKFEEETLDKARDYQ